MWIILAVQLLGCIGTGRPVPNTCLTGITHIGQMTQMGARGTPAPQARKARGNPPW
jgi:hypothetical protein